VYPMENAGLGLLVLVAIVVVFWRLAVRGPSRIMRAMLTVAALIVCVWLVSAVAAYLSHAA
jgi:hypothetical protein